MNNNEVYNDTSSVISNTSLSPPSTSKYNQITLHEYMSVIIYSLFIISLTTVSLYDGNSKSICNDAFTFLLYCYRVYALLTLSLILLTFVIVIPYYKVITILLQGAYYLFVIYSYIIVKNNYTDKCLYTKPYTYSTIVLIIIIGIGVIDIIRDVFFLIELLCVFPCVVQLFLQNPTEFITQYGIDQTILSKWPTILAKDINILNYKDICIICTYTIKSHHEVIQLKCDKRHVFHSNCIRKWLTYKVECPLCKSKYIL